jgi:hypothetical protein
LDSAQISDGFGIVFGGFARVLTANLPVDFALNFSRAHSLRLGPGKLLDNIAKISLDVLMLDNVSQANC